MSSVFEGRVGFAVGTGRCGTHFLDALLRREPDVASSHERDPLNETFHRYCKWYRLPIDHEGFFTTKEGEIARDLENHQVSCEASAHLSFSISELYQRFRAKFLLLVRCPERVVDSYFRKGQIEGEACYAEPFVQADPNLGLGYQRCCKFHHFLGRIAPVGEEFQRWNGLTQVGKLAWYWNTINTRALEQFAALPRDHWRLIKLEELDYDCYQELARFLGFRSRVSRRTFRRIAEARPGAVRDGASAPTWTGQELREFEDEVLPMAERLRYHHRPMPRAAIRPKRRFPRPRRLARGIIERLRVRVIERLGGRP